MKSNIMMTLACVMLVSCGSKNDADMITKAKEMIKSHERYVKASNLDSVMTNMAENITVLVPSHPLIQGKKELRQFYSGMLETGTMDFTHEYTDVKKVGNAVIFEGVARGTFTLPDGTENPIENNFLLITKQIENTEMKVWKAAFAPRSMP